MNDNSASQDKKPSQEEINKALEGAPYPATKEELAKYAQSQGASSEVVKAIEALPDVIYKTTDALTQALNKLLPINLKETLDKLL